MRTGRVDRADRTLRGAELCREGPEPEQSVSEMAHVSSEVQKAGSDDGSAGAGNSAPSPPRDHAPPGDLDLRSVIEENAFQSLSEGTLIRRLCFTCSDPGADEDNDFRFMTFPRKLWKIVGSSQFKSIWWDEQGTSIVIHEDQFKKEVLERKGPFKIFETGSMKSLVRQLNLYGFSKLRQAFQRSASLRDFLAEEKEVSVLSKVVRTPAATLKCYKYIL